MFPMNTSINYETKSNAAKFAAASFVYIADTPCGSCCKPTVQQLKRSTVKIYVNHFLLVLGDLPTRFVFVNRCCLKAVSRSWSMQENLHLNCSTGISSWCTWTGCWDQFRRNDIFTRVFQRQAETMSNQKHSRLFFLFFSTPLFIFSIMSELWY